METKRYYIVATIMAPLMVLLFAGLQLLLVSQWRPGTSSALAYSLFCSPKLWEGRLWTLQMKQTDEGTDVWEVLYRSQMYAFLMFVFQES